MEKFYSFEDLGKLNGGKKEISEDLTIEDEENNKEVLEEFKAGDDVDLDSEELENMLAEELEEEKVPYIAKKYMDNPLDDDMNKSRKSHSKKHIGGHNLKGKAKKKDKIIIGVNNRRKNK